MSGYLVDTNAISLLSNNRASPAFLAWLEEQQRKNLLFISAITLEEIKRGITKLEMVKAGNPSKAKRLGQWLETLCVDFQDRILPVDVPVALTAGRLEGMMQARGHNGELADILIAATAEFYGLSVVTANIRDFEVFGITCLAPF
ncbi:type II toxin-antitoxin system VapC family toxin [Pararhizobium gei]|uniref:type II toxin-antitoxin system VapC family toxin n=1 Tax=Pararhizobium gei TaxID=1395951 RepID=UPI0023DC2B1D|nr:type II toxin-antitoxin system VapC family toxin [Rhizobium gei]